MIARGHIVLGIILMICQSAAGQTGNHLVDAVGFHYTFNSAENLVIDYADNSELLDDYINFATFCVSDYKGKLLASGSEIPYHSKNIPVNLDKLPTLETVTMRLSDSICLVFYLQDINYATPRDPAKYNVYYKTLLLQNGKAIFANEPAKLLIDKHIYSMVSIADTSGGFWLVTKHDTIQFSSYYFKGSSQPLYSSNSKLSIDPVFTTLKSGWERASPSGNFILSHRFGRKIIADTFTLTSDKVDLLSFDKVTGRVTEHSQPYSIVDTMWHRSFALNNNSVLDRSISSYGYEVTSDDIYTFLSENVVVGKPNVNTNRFLRVNNITQETIVLRSERADQIVDTLPNGSIGLNSGYFDIRLLNNRKLYLKKALAFFQNNDEKYFVFDCIDNPNDFNPVFIDRVQTSPKEKRAYVAVPFSTTPYNYLIVKPSIKDEACVTTVTFIDKCDYSLPNTKVTYYTEEVAGSGVLVARGENPTLNYTKSGNYLCKVVLKSHEGTYKEVWYDTLKIRIPPVAAFTAADTLVCAHVPLAFTNQCVSDTVHPVHGELWVWTFGDGNTLTIDKTNQSNFSNLISHVYKKPGTYTVSLFYSNGFCDSTLVKNRYITVVDAPAPGFSISDTFGCTPATIIVTDTVTYNTTKKEYNYNDGRGWLEVPVTQKKFSNTYYNAGAYWIVQRLYGYTN